MRIAYFGTPEFALPALKTLHQSRHSVVGVVTAPDKPRGRGQREFPTPVAALAESLKLPVRKPVSLKNQEFVSAIRTWQCDLFVVVAFRILPEEVFTIPKWGTINLHASLLPQYRGAAPIQWALFNGEKETGLTTFCIEKTVDTGNILKQRSVKIFDEDDAGSLSNRLANLGAELLLETLAELEIGTLVPRRQADRLSTAAPKISKDHCKIDWNRSPEEIRNQMRAFSPEPGAFSILETQIVKFLSAAIYPNSQHFLTPGEILITDNQIVVGAGSGNLQIHRLQLQGKKCLSSSEFLRGFRQRGRFKLR
ncbi:MAG: methionyl-tRNA formyltransferase [bacterium]